MKIINKTNKQQISLTDKYFKASGGQGTVYIKDNMVYKIYHNNVPCIEEFKIKELNKINNDQVILPIDILLSLDGNNIGYTMKLVEDGYEICQLFNKAFKERHSLNNNQLTELVIQLKQIVYDVHKAKCLIVDLNEFNFIVNKNFNKIYSIDTDSFQTPNYKATALMESVRDRHNKTFHEDTDWFAYAIVTFQLYMGIHPYKGIHSKYRNINDRMINNISVFNKEVRLPSICPSFDTIPKQLKDWYIELFDKGVRSAPPDNFDEITIPIVRRAIENLISVKFKIVNVKTLDDDILHHLYFNNQDLFITKNFIINGNSKIVNKFTNGWIIPKKSIDNQLYNITIKNNVLRIFDIFKNDYVKRNGNEITYEAERGMVYNNLFYYILNNGIYELDLEYFTCKLMANCTDYSTQVFGGVIFQTLLKSSYVYYFPEKGKTEYVKIEELNNYKIVNARYINKLLFVIGRNLANQSGEYDKFIIKIDKGKYNLRKIENIDYIDINCAVTSKGICAHILEDGVLEIFNNQIDNFSINIVKDNIITTDITLTSSNEKIGYIKQNKFNFMSIKND